ncbi:caspase domain-containing protein [Candidatus Neomarinimicrobiota bacterium]
MYLKSVHLKFTRPEILILLLLNVTVGQKFEGYSSAKKVVIGNAAESFAELAANDTLSFPTSDIDLDIPTTTIKRPDAIGVVIGISKYSHADVPRVDYARRDALLMRDYMIRGMGFSEENIIVALDGDATQAVFNRIFGGQLENFIKAGQSDVFVYYSGHGAPDVNKSSAYFVAHDTDPNYPVQTGYSLDSFYAQLDQLQARSVTVVLDACFSGASDAGMVIQQASPIFISVENPAANLKNGVVMTSSSGDQISSWYREKGHGLFTYYFLKGLRGEADRDQDDQVTSTELYGYLMEHVPYLARRKFNREQTPQLMGEALDQVLVAY